MAVFEISVNGDRRWTTRAAGRGPELSYDNRWVFGREREVAE